ncbi:MAG: hypothetical protein ABSG90_14940 [Dehalococcoidia bacterium]|jgi:hypothetical protein
MSWASHNVEAYDDILHKAIVARIQAELTDNGFNGMCTDTITAIVESISQATDSKPYNALLDWSTKHISECERDHFDDMADSTEYR